MKLSLVLVLALSVNLLAYSDSDLDGVEDSIDRCPETPMSDLVDTDGCTVKSLKSAHHFDLVAGVGYSQMNYASNEKADTITSSLQADYYYKKFSAQFSSSRYSSKSRSVSDSGLNDTLIAAYYRFLITNQFTLKVGGGVLLPTYDSGYHNEAADYQGSIHFSYTPENSKSSLIGGFSYTAVNDNDIAGIIDYQNTSAYYIGGNYLLNEKLSIGATYNHSDSLYRSVETIRKVSAYGMVRIDSHWFTTLNYSYGLSDSAGDHAADLRIGYYF